MYVLRSTSAPQTQSHMDNNVESSLALTPKPCRLGYFVYSPTIRFSLLRTEGNQHLEMALSNEITASSADERQGILFVAAYCGLQQKVNVQEGPELQFVTPDGHTYTSYTSVCRHLANISSKSQQLLGSTALDRAKVSASPKQQLQQ